MPLPGACQLAVGSWQLAVRLTGGSPIVKGCAFGALRSIVALAAIVVAIGGGLNYVYGGGPRDVIGVSLLAGLAGWIGLNLLLSAVRAWRERAALNASISGTPPVDGRPTILAGYIEPAGPGLRAPLSGRECAAYTFEVYEMRRVGKSSSKVVYCDGVALTPSSVVTPGGSYRLLAVPELDCDEVDLDRKAAIARAAELMRTLPFQPPPKPFTRPSIEDQWNDDDGEFRRDRRRTEEPVDLEPCRLSERLLERGARVCVFGHYSADKRAIVADPDDWTKITRVMKGDAAAVVAQLGSSIVRRLIGAVIFAGAAAGITAAFVSNLA